MFAIYKEEIRHLIDNIDNLKQILGQQNTELKQIKEENLKLKTSIKEKELTIEDLETKYRTLLNAQAISQNLGGSENAKAKINTLVREIDKCIALLND